MRRSGFSEPTLRATDRKLLLSFKLLQPRRVDRSGTPQQASEELHVWLFSLQSSKIVATKCRSALRLAIIVLCRQLQPRIDLTARLDSSMPAPRHFLDGLTPLTEETPPSKADEVEKLTAQMGEAMNTNDFSKFDFENHMAAEYTINDDHHFLGNYAWRTGTIPLSQRLEEHKRHCEKYPDYRLEIFDISTFVDERGQTADVFINCKTVGLPEIGRCGEGVMILRWVWQSPGRWVAVKGTALRGSAGQAFA